MYILLFQANQFKAIKTILNLLCLAFINNVVEQKTKPISLFPFCHYLTRLGGPYLDSARNEILLFNNVYDPFLQLRLFICFEIVIFFYLLFYRHYKM